MKRKNTQLITNLLILLALSTSVFTSCNSTDKKQSEDVVFQKVKHPEWSKNLSIYEVNIRQYTPEGTFNAFAEHLPRLKELGSDILWLMPINPIGEKNKKGIIGSYYCIKDYRGVNPLYGTPDDFKNLINKIHELGMYVIIDWVANHSSWDNQVIEDHPDWYTQDENGNIISPNEDWHDVADFNYDNPEMWQYMKNSMIYWVKEYNIDGFRCDMASMSPTEFWIDVRKELDLIKPVFLLAESEDPELNKFAFDMTYTWELHHLMNDIAQQKKSVEDLIKVLQKYRSNFPKYSYRMTFTSNHDENRKGCPYEKLGDAVKTFAVLTYTVPGMPLIYGGQEACSKKRLKEFDKDTIDWKECDMFDLYKNLNILKKENQALWNGDFGGSMDRIATTADDQIFAFERKKDDNRVITILNLSPEEVEFRFVNPIETNNLTELFTNEELGNNFKLNAWGYKVFRNK